VLDDGGAIGVDNVQLVLDAGRMGGHYDKVCACVFDVFSKLKHFFAPKKGAMVV